MFTGIIEAVGKVIRLEPKGGDFSLHMDTGKLDMSDVKLGDSIATNGVCLTVVQRGESRFVADVSAETISRTSLQQLTVGSSVNLEKALTLATRLGGHLVSGHVDAVAEVISREEAARSIHFRVSIPAGLGKYIAEKGSICVDGISLTVNQVDETAFDLNIVPHTALATTVDNWRSGTRVNIEVDQVARYLERLLLGDASAKPSEESALTKGFLAEHGYLK